MMNVSLAKIGLVVGSVLLMVGCASSFGSCAQKAPVLDSTVALRRNATNVNVPEEWHRDTYEFFNPSNFPDLSVTGLAYASRSSFNGSFDSGYTYILQYADVSWSASAVSYDTLAFVKSTQTPSAIAGLYGYSLFEFPWIYVGRVAQSGVYRVEFCVSFDWYSLVTYYVPSGSVASAVDVSSDGRGYKSVTFDFSDSGVTPTYSVSFVRYRFDNYIDDVLAGFVLADSYNVGYDDGYVNGNQDGYDDGFADGRSAGIGEGYANGVAQGNSQAFAQGSAQGYSNGFRDGANGNTGGVLNGLFGAVVGVPISLLNGLSPLVVWNIPIISILVTFLFVALVLWIVRKALGK